MWSYIISDSDLDARENANSLQRLVEQQVELDSNLSIRLEALQLPPAAMKPDKLDCSPSGEPQEPEDTELAPLTPTRPGSPRHHDHGNNAIPELGLPIPETFEVILSTTRVYHRVRDREPDDRTSVSTTRSHAWSVLSGLSLAEISVIAVIKLPLHKAELERFRRLASPSWIAYGSVAGEYFAEFENYPLWQSEENDNLRSAGRLPEDFQRRYGLLSRSNSGSPSMIRIAEECRALARDRSPSISVGPVGDALVRVSIQLDVSRSANRGQERWQGTILGPVSRWFLPTRLNLS